MVSDDIIFVDSNYESINIDLNKIEYLQSSDHYIRIYFTGGEFVILRTTFKKIIEKLPVEKFVRIHLRYIVSIDKIKSIRNKKVELNKIELPVSDSYFKTLKTLIKK